MVRWFFVWTYRAVAIATRLGVPPGASVCACWKSVPCAASLSKAGDLATGWPYVPSDSARTASGRKRRKFVPEDGLGGSGGGEGGPCGCGGAGDGARPDVPAVQSDPGPLDRPWTVEKRKQWAEPATVGPPQWE